MIHDDFLTNPPATLRNFIVETVDEIANVAPGCTLSFNGTFGGPENGDFVMFRLRFEIGKRVAMADRSVATAMLFDLITEYDPKGWPATESQRRACIRDALRKFIRAIVLPGLMQVIEREIVGSGWMTARWMTD